MHSCSHQEETTSSEYESTPIVTPQITVLDPRVEIFAVTVSVQTVERARGVTMCFYSV